MVRFGIFEFDLLNGKLTRKGYPVKLQQQPAQLLAYLIQRAGNLVTRDELQSSLWPTGTFVEFDDGLNTAVNRIRRTLGDSAAAPKYIETVPKQGYRFVAPVEYLFPAPAEPALVERAPLPVQLVQEVTQEPPAPVDALIEPPRRRWSWIAASIAVVVSIAGAAFWFLRPAPSHQAASPIRYSIALPQNHKVEALAISPTGDQIVYQASVRDVRSLYRRFLNAEESRPIPGTENANFPFFSPDGSEIGFYSAGKLKAAGASGVRELVSIPSGFVQYNAFWSQDGVYFNTMDSQGIGIWRVPAAGGQPERILNSAITEAGMDFVFGHQMLRRHALLYSTVLGPTRRSIKLLDMNKHVSQTLVERGMGGVVLPTGHLLYYWRGSLFAAPFDVQADRLTAAVEVLQNVESLAWTGPSAAVSRNGTLAYLKAHEILKTLLWVDRTGKQTPIAAPAAAYEQAEVSPDGGRLAIVRQDAPELWTLWVHDLRTGAWSRMLETAIPKPRAVWSPDGKSLVASSARDNADFVNLYRIPVDAPEKAERLTEQPNLGQFAQSWSAKANAILFVQGVHPVTFGDILVLPLSGNRRPRPLVASAGWDITPDFSPDGTQFAYASEHQGNLEVFVRSYPQSSSPVQISKGGGSSPLWAHDGRHLYYLSRSCALMEVEIARDGTPGEPKELVPAGFTDAANMWTRGYSMGKDGHFLVIRHASGGVEAASQIHVVVNWFEELKRLAPVP